MTTLLAEKLTDLDRAGVAPAIVARLRDYIEQAPDAGLLKIPPLHLADEWQQSRQEVLEAFLYGTRLGLFDLGWHIRCPSCKGQVADHFHLNTLHAQSHCDYCKINIQAGLDEHVEVTFQVNPNIRQPQGELPMDYWGNYSPIGKYTVAPGVTVDLPFESEEITYHIYVPEKGSLPIVIHSEPTTQERVVRVNFDGEVKRPDTHFYPTGAWILRLTNLTDAPVEFTMIRYHTYPWLSAAQLATTQSFRDLFATELIATDETFSIRNMVLVFTDIKGSTALYEQLGDSQAYLLVKEHFKILTRTVKEHRGAVVKTIGDAVMATFLVSADAVAALFAVQRAFDEFDVRESIPEGHIIIKVGAHRGPCIAVNSNDRLDYFGRTVNIAARVQGLSTGRDIMLTRSLYDEPEVRAVVDSSGWQAQPLQATLRGLEMRYDLMHLLPPQG